MRKLLSSLFLSGLVGLTISCATTETLPPAQSLPPSPRHPGLRPNDVLEIQVFDEEQLSGKFQVSESGTIDYPLVGRVQVEGLTPPQVADLITKKLRDGFLRNPSVSVLAKDYAGKKQIHVWGQVKQSGTFTYSYNMSLIEAITLAGGTTPLADNEFRITRVSEDGETKTYQVPADKGSQHVLKPGDVVFVPERVF